MKTGTIVFEDYKGQSATVKVSKASSLSAVRELAEKLGGYSRAFQSTRPRGARLHQQNLLITQDFLPSFR